MIPNNRIRKNIHRPITAKDREAFKAQVEALREKLNPKQLKLKALS